MSLARWLILLGAITLFCGAILHTIGYTFFIPVLIKNNLPTVYVNAVRSIWLTFAWDGIVLSVAFVWFSRVAGARKLVLLLALVPLIDALLMYHFVGLFIGTYVVSTAAVLLLVGAWLLPRGYAS